MDERHTKIIYSPVHGRVYEIPEKRRELVKTLEAQSRCNATLSKDKDDHLIVDLIPQNA
jgi:hypothetical protein